MKLPLDYKLPSLFLGNFFCLIPNTNAAFVIIAKNGCAFLKKVAIYNNTNEWVTTEEAHSIVGFSIKSNYLVPVSKMKQYEEKNGKLMKFAVWRDPVVRVTSAYKFFCLEREYRTYFHYLGINESISFERFKDFLVFEWHKKPAINQDEHVRRQVDYYKPRDVDHIIPIENLYSFLENNNIKFKKEQTNKTNVAFEIVNEEDLKNIKEHYKADYKIKLK